MTGVDPHGARTPQDVPDLTLAEFHLARLNEIERRERGRIRYGSAVGEPCPICGREVREHNMEGGLDVVRHTLGPCGHDLLNPNYAAWVGTESAADPFVLRDVAAKRRIVELHGREHECVLLSGTGLNIGGWSGGSGDECTTLRLLAEVYADHPDWREEWRP